MIRGGELLEATTARIGSPLSLAPSVSAMAKAG
jgi:hypothetical protein